MRNSVRTPIFPSQYSLKYDCAPLSSASLGQITSEKKGDRRHSDREIQI